MEVNNLIVNGTANFLNNIEVFEKDLIILNSIGSGSRTISYLIDLPLDCKYITLKLTAVGAFISIMRIPIEEWKSGENFVLYCQGDSAFQNTNKLIVWNENNSLKYSCGSYLGQKRLSLSVTANYI